MKKTKKILSVLICFMLVFTLVQGSLITPQAKSSSEWQKTINELKKKKAGEGQVLDAIRQKIAAINAEIATYNNKINQINGKIAQNKAEISKNETEIEGDKLQFKKSLRAIQMSGNQSDAMVLLGAKSFSVFLQLSQFTSSISSHDKRLIEDLVGKIKVLNEKNAENEKLVEEQVAAKSVVVEKQQDLKAQEAEAAAIYNKTESEEKDAQAQYAAEKKAEEDRIKRSASGGSGSAQTPSFVNESGAFLWPVAGFYGISAGYQSNDAVHRGSHNGIDISGGGIAGAPIRATSDGYVSYVNNSCSHNYGKNGSCGCGGGYGNYCVINHGSIGGATYSAYYAHAQRITVSAGQYVKRGQVIGYVGTTGWSTGYHLHFGVLRNGGWINPSSLSYQK